MKRHSVQITVGVNNITFAGIAARCKMQENLVTGHVIGRSVYPKHVLPTYGAREEVELVLLEDYSTRNNPATSHRPSQTKQLSASFPVKLMVGLLVFLCTNSD